MTALQYILWNPPVEAFHIGGLSIRWYSICWCLGLLACYVIVQKLYNKQNLNE